MGSASATCKIRNVVDKIRIAAALRYCYVHLFHIHQAISEEDISALYSVALSFSVHIITFYVDLPDAQNNMAVKVGISYQRLRWRMYMPAMAHALAKL